jgi:hypothetical protein
LVPTVLLALASGFLWYQNRAAAATVSALSEKVPQLLLPVGADNPLSQQLGDIRAAASRGSFSSARSRAEALALPPGMTPSMPEAPAVPGAPDGSGAATSGQLPPEATQFFETHPDVAQRLSAYSAAAASARDQGKDVQPLRDLRTKIIAAAAAGDVAQVSAGLDEFARGLQALGAPTGGPSGPSGPGGPGRAPSPAMQKLMMQFGQAYEQAQRQGRDPRAAVALIRQSQMAAMAGHEDQAAQLGRQALAALKRAPQMSGGAPGAGRGPAGRPSAPPPGKAEQALSSALATMNAEEKDLSATYDALEQAQKNQPDNADLRKLLEAAKADLTRIRDRRAAFSASLRGQMPAPPTPVKPGTPGAPATPGTAATGAPQVPPQVADKFAQLVDTIRGMTVDEYHKVRDGLAAQLLEMLTAPPAPAPGAAVAPGMPAFAPGMTTEDRVREKLLQAGAAYQQLHKQGKDSAVVKDLLRQSREELWSGKAVLAESSVDEALRDLAGLLSSTGGPLSLERSAAPLSPLSPRP